MKSVIIGLCVALLSYYLLCHFNKNNKSDKQNKNKIIILSIVIGLILGTTHYFYFANDSVKIFSIDKLPLIVFDANKSTL